MISNIRINPWPWQELLDTCAKMVQGWAGPPVTWPWPIRHDICVVEVGQGRFRRILFESQDTAPVRPTRGSSQMHASVSSEVCAAAAWVSTDCPRETFPAHGSPGWFARRRWTPGRDGGRSPIRTVVLWRHVVNGHGAEASTSPGEAGMSMDASTVYAHNLLETWDREMERGRLGRG